MSLLQVCRKFAGIAIGNRNLHTSVPLSVKKFVETKEGNKTIIEGVIEESGRKPYLVKTENDDHACPLCRLNLNLKHTDVLILSQFLRSDGLLLPRRVTGLCGEQQKRLTQLVSMAHIAGLMPNLVPKYSKKDCFKKRREWKKYNRYFVEKTIKVWDSWYKDKDGRKEKRYRELNVQFDTEPWKDLRKPLLDISKPKLSLY